MRGILGIVCVSLLCVASCEQGNQYVEVCGNGVVDSGEECDEAGDGELCDHNCTWAICGDATVNTTAGELCDDGNVEDGDGCSADCLSDETCGNLQVDVAVGEECDEGEANGVSPNVCTAACLLNVCGDGHLGSDEQCDDGEFNGMSPRVCSASCTVNPDTCGNGIVETGEACDDGNFEGGDGCEPECLLTPTLLVGAPLCPEQFVIDASHVYFTNPCTDEVMSVPKIGGAPMTIASGPVELAEIAVDATHVYWIENDGSWASPCQLVKAPKTGGSPVYLADLGIGYNVTGIAVGPNNVYVTGGIPSFFCNGMTRVPIHGGAPVELTSWNNPTGVLTDSTHVYFLANRWDSCGSDGVYRMELGGGSIEGLGDPEIANRYHNCAVDETYLYFTSGAIPLASPDPDLVVRLPKGGGTHEVLVVDWDAAVCGMTVDDTHVYWSTCEGEINKAEKPGEFLFPTVTLATRQQVPGGLAVDTTHIYWLNSATSEILKTPK